MNIGIPFLAALALAGTAMPLNAAPTDGARPLTGWQAKALNKALKGKEAGQPVPCISGVVGNNSLTPISDGVLVYKAGRNLAYRNDLNGECTGISTGATLVLRPTNGQYCRGDIADVVNLSTGSRGASCSLGDFVPYRTPGK